MYLPLYLVIILLSRILSIVKILICELYIGITILAWFIRVSTNGELKELETQEMDIETPLILVELIWREQRGVSLGCCVASIPRQKSS